jgi:MscS family membrane protein
MAQYLKSVIDRAGYVTWQEIPDDPNRGSVYVFYRHPEGLVAIDRTLGQDGKAGRWKFTARTVRGAPALFAAMQDLPVAGAIAPSRPITPFFTIRERVRAIAPALLHRIGPLDLWQWAAFPAAILLSILLGRLFAAVMAIGLSRSLRCADRSLRVKAARRLGAPAGIAAASGMAIFIMVWLGMAETALAPFMVAMLSALTASLAWLSFRITGIAGGYFQRRAERSAGFVDEIATSLVFGLLKLGIIAFGAIAIADVIGIPYEGVIAGLGVGDIALAFAARDTVQNVIGGAILMTDRPFRRGDLVETDATMAFVEGVGLPSTRLRTLDDSVLIIPNSRLTDRSIVNWGQRRKRKIRLEISLSYDTPRDRLDAFVRDLRSIYMLQPGSDGTTGFVGLTSLGSSSLDIELWDYFKVSDHHGLVAARHRLIGDIIDLAHRQKISFAFPTRTIRIVPEIDEDAAASAP